MLCNSSDVCMAADAEGAIKEYFRAAHEQIMGIIPQVVAAIACRKWWGRAALGPGAPGAECRVGSRACDARGPCSCIAAVLPRVGDHCDRRASGQALPDARARRRLGGVPS